MTYADNRSQQKQYERDIAAILLSKKITDAPIRTPRAVINHMIFNMFFARARLVLIQ